MASKNYGDVVTMVRNGVEVNALVAMSSPQADGEHLSVIYLDPKASSSQLTGMQLDAAVKKEFGVTAYADGKPVGFKEYESLNEANLKFLEATDTDITATQSTQIKDLNEKLETTTKALADQEKIATEQTDQIRKLSDENAQLKKDFANTQQAIAEVTDENAELKGEISRCGAERDTLLGKVNPTDAQTAELVKESEMPNPPAEHQS